MILLINIVRGYVNNMENTKRKDIIIFINMMSNVFVSILLIVFLSLLCFYFKLSRNILWFIIIIFTVKLITDVLLISYEK